MTAFVAPLTEAGFDVIACDLPGHGEASGKRLHIPLAIAALQALHAETGPLYGIIGHSFGGAIASDLIGSLVEGQPAIKISRLVLIAAPHSMPRICHGFGAAVGLTARSQSWFDANVMRLTGRAQGPARSWPPAHPLCAGNLVGFRRIHGLTTVLTRRR
jgi:alpha-beta hydrolase superfamily lysophospholipase